MSSVVLLLEISLNVTIVQNLPFIPVYTHGCLTGNHGMSKILLLTEIIWKLERHYNKKICVNLNWG